MQELVTPPGPTTSKSLETHRCKQSCPVIRNRPLGFIIKTSTFFSLSCFIDVLIHFRPMFSSFFSFAFYIRPLSLPKNCSNSLSLDKYLPFPASLPPLSRLSSARLTTGFYKSRLFSFCTTPSSGKVESTRRNVVYNGSTENDGGRSNTLISSAGICKTFSDVNST